MQYCRNLKFEEKPDYTLLRKYLQDVSERMNYEHDYYYDWILKNSSMSKRMSKSNIPIPPKIKLDNTSKENKVEEMENKNTSRQEIVNENKNKNLIGKNDVQKQRHMSVDPPIIRRDSYNITNNFAAGSNRNNNIKYGSVNPINGLTTNAFNPKSVRKENPTTLMAATGIISNDPTKYTKFNSRMGESAMNFARWPPIQTNYNNKPYPMNRSGSQHINGYRNKNDFNSYFRTTAQAMFGSHAVVMPKVATNHVLAKY